MAALFLPHTNEAEFPGVTARLAGNNISRQGAKNAKK